MVMNTLNGYRGDKGCNMPYATNNRINYGVRND